MCAETALVPSNYRSTGAVLTVEQIQAHQAHQVHQATQATQAQFGPNWKFRVAPTVSISVMTTRPSTLNIINNNCHKRKADETTDSDQLVEVQLQPPKEKIRKTPADLSDVAAPLSSAGSTLTTTFGSTYNTVLGSTTTSTTYSTDAIDNNVDNSDERTDDEEDYDSSKLTSSMPDEKRDEALRAQRWETYLERCRIKVQRLRAGELSLKDVSVMELLDECS